LASSSSLLMADKRVLVLFDVDGTLTPARQSITQEMRDLLKELRKTKTIGVVGGSDFPKQKEQLGSTVLSDFDYSFAENGLYANKNGKLIHEQSFKDHLGEAPLKELINFILHYIADLDIPIKRGTFIEFRSGMLNVSPIGRNCSLKERVEFEEYDRVHRVRAKMVEALEKKFESLNLRYSIGGQISLDVFPRGWDKTYCLRHVENEGFSEIHFFGDKTQPGENDYELYNSGKVIGHAVKSPDDTIRILKELFFSQQ